MNSSTAHDPSRLLLTVQIETDQKAQNAARLEFMKKNRGPNRRFAWKGERETKLEPDPPQPVLRWDNPPVVYRRWRPPFVWMSGPSSPQVIGGVWIQKNGVSHIDLQSLAQGPLTATLDRPAGPGFPSRTPGMTWKPHAECSRAIRDAPANDCTR